MSPEWIPAVAGIVGALVGAIAAIVPSYFIESYRLRKEAELTQASLIAEMTALVEIADERQYLASIEQIVAHLRSQPMGIQFSLQIRIPTHYSRIYQANAQRIGLIEKRVAADIVRFHQLVDAVVQDVTEGGAISSGATLPAFEQAQQILTRALAIGRIYAGRT